MTRLHLCSQPGQMSLSRVLVPDTEAGYRQTRAGRAQKILSSSFFENTQKYSCSAPLYATCIKFLQVIRARNEMTRDQGRLFLAGVQLTEHREDDIAERILHAQRYLSGFQTGFLPSSCRLVKPECRACDKFDTDRLLVTALRPWPQLSRSRVISTKRAAVGLTHENYAALGP